jgi:hypothetical protein
MADPYIDQYETLSYGPFAVEHLLSTVLPLDRAFHAAVRAVADQLQHATSAMQEALGQAGEITVATFKGHNGEADPVKEARSLLSRLGKYVGSRKNADALTTAIFGGESPYIVVKRRPRKLLGALDLARKEVAKKKNAAALPEHAEWSQALETAHTDLAKLVENVRDTRLKRRDMTPAIVAGRLHWLRVYGAAKLIAEGVLRLHQREQLMPEIFDDLAEVHHVAGVSDASPPSPPAGEAATPLAGASAASGG